MVNAASTKTRILAAICTVSLVMTCICWAASRPKHPVRTVNTIHLPLALPWSSVLMDISKQGFLLVFAWGQRDAGDPRVQLWDYRRQQAATEIPLRGWPDLDKKAPESIGDPRWQFRFQGDGNRIVALQTPWLVLLDVAKQAEIRRIVPSESYLQKDAEGEPASIEGHLRVAYLAVNPQDGSVAAAFNVGKQTHLYVYDSRLQMQTGSYSLPRAVCDLCWSPDGKKLAVLFFGWLDENRKSFYYWYRDTLHRPDVWVIDARTGEPLVKFWTGSTEDRIAFSRDGSLIYTIDDYTNVQYGGAITAFLSGAQVRKAALRVFSAASGAQVQTIAAGPKGIHTDFAFSPDGRLIAADASTYVPLILGWREMEQPSGKIARVVLLDAKTGDLLFEHHERTEGNIWEPLGMAFSPGGRLLFVDFPRGDRCSHHHVEVYSLDDIYETTP